MSEGSASFNCELMEYLQMFARPTSTGRLIVKNTYIQGNIYLFDGSIVHAEVDGLQGVEACYHMLSWTQSELTWEKGTAPNVSTLETTADVLLQNFLAGDATAKPTPPSSTLNAHELLLIHVLNGPNDGQAFEISQPTLQIGSDSECEICLQDPTVSRLHCEIKQVGGRILAEDLNSTNGTWLNGWPFHSGEIQSGDTLQLGQTALKIEVLLKRPAAASRARTSTKIGNPGFTTTSLINKPKTATIHWKNEAEAAQAKKTGKGLWHKLLKT